MDTLTSWKLGLAPDRMRELDRLAEAEFGIAPLQLMEVAGLQTARVAWEVLGPSPHDRAVCILAGKGNNGADGLVAARRLLGWGARVTVVTSFQPAEAAGLTATQLTPLRACAVEIAAWTGSLPAADLYIDALLGFGSSGAPRGAVAEMIGALPRGHGVLALDLPSGLDAASGDTPGACVFAEATVTLGLAKTGLLQPSAKAATGRLYLADIGIPRALLVRVGIDPTGLFEVSDLVRIG